MSAPAAKRSDAPAEILARLARLHPATIDLDLSRLQRLLADMGHPERQLPPVIHVGGTNGKGSTTAYIRAICEASGLRVHVFTSPHLVRVNESIRIGAVGGGQLIDDFELTDALALVELTNAGQAITEFEALTAAMLHVFAQHPADVAIIEVGLGGALDATNVIEQPLACVFTPISIDHVEFLGDSVMKIAMVKAGIIKRGAAVICAEQLPEAIAVIERQAARMRAPMHRAGQEWHVGMEHGRLVYQDDKGLLDLAAPRLFGRHQVANAGLAIAALRAQNRFKISVDAFEQGVIRAEWPARMQRLSSGRLLEIAPQGAEIWLDGGHNIEGGRVVAAAIADLEERVPRPLVVIAGMMANKDAVGFLENFAGLTRHILVVPIRSKRGAMAAEDMIAAARGVGMRAELHGDVGEALQALTKLAYEVPPRILITGSLYLAGEVLAANGTPPV